MKELAAYLLASLATESGEPTTDSVSKILSSVGIDVDESRVSAVVSELSGKVIADVIAEGTKKFGSMPAGGAVAAAPAGGAPAAAAGGAPAKEEKKEEVAEESDDDMGFGLFD